MTLLKCILVVVFIVGGFNAAAVESRLDRGVWEIALEGSPDFLGPTGDTLNIKGGYGLFIRDRWLLRGTLHYTTVEDVAPGDNDYRMRELGVGLEYHFWQGTFVPYVGVDLGYRRSKFSFRNMAMPPIVSTNVESGAVFGPRIGFKYFLADNLAIDVAFTYKLATADVFVSDFEAESSLFGLSFGLRGMF